MHLMKNGDVAYLISNSTEIQNACPRLFVGVSRTLCGLSSVRLWFHSSFSKKRLWVRIPLKKAGP